MTVAYLPPASIECVECLITARKIIPSLPVKSMYRDTNFSLLYPFKLDRNCEATISRELEPKAAIVDQRSMLSSGDGVRGLMISGLSASLPKQDRAAVRSTSGRHQASHISLNGFVFAKLEKPFRALENKINLLPSVR
jgi:hypothetical protein